MKIKIALIINGSRKLKSSASESIDKLKSNSIFDCALFKTEYSRHAIELARKATLEKYNVVIAVGGDGTCNEVVNGIMLVSDNPEIIFGIIPNGTGNDFFKMFEEFQTEKFIDSLSKLSSRSIDLIKIESHEKTSYALNIAGIGFDGHVVQYLNEMKFTRLLGGKITYALSILKAFVTFKAIKTEIISEEFKYSGKTLMLAVCNGHTFAHGLIINPDAKIDDGWLSISLLGNVSFKDYVLNLSNLKKGRHIHHPEIFYFSTKEVTIKLSEPTYFTEMDGEIFGKGDVNFRVIPNVIKIIH